MKFNIQMVDNTVSSEWWKTIIHHFIKVGDNFEIRCWKEETEEILQVKRYGKAIADGNEISIKGAFVDELLLELMEENPADKEIYNKDKIFYHQCKKRIMRYLELSLRNRDVY